MKRWIDQLSSLSVEQLQDVERQGSAADFNAAVSGAQGAALAPDLLPKDLGDSGKDLVFTKVTPCRIVDTRASTKLPDGGARNFLVAGTVGFAGQGGNATGCGVAFGATGVALNLTLTGENGYGWLRAWPYAGVPANASVINFSSTTGDIANGLMLPICDPAAGSCLSDLTVMADAAGTHVIIDVMGYFMKPTKLGTLKTFTVESNTFALTYLPESSACVNYTGGSITITAPGPGQILVEANVNLGMVHTVTAVQEAWIGIFTIATTCSPMTWGNATFTTVTAELPSGTYHPWTLARQRFTVTAAGTYTYYLNGFKHLGGANSIYFFAAAMAATFSPQ